MNSIKKYASLVKFSHTVFALPFALLAYVWASKTAYVAAIGAPHALFNGWLLLKILVCMVLARNAAMGFNRWADRRFDAENPRTAGREIPSGAVKPRSVLIFTIVNAAGFVVVAGLINRLALILSPVALAVILGYSYTKRFTSLSHIVLGAALAIAPSGACVAVLGRLEVPPMLMSALVLTWVAGFDILYSMQDAAHDRAHGLHSIPAHFSPTAAVGLSIFLHLLTLALAVILGIAMGGGVLFWVGTGLFAAMLVIQHLIFGPTKTGRIARLFTTLNGASSIVFALFLIADILLK